MTLIVSVGNSEHFIQVSDRRLSSNGKIIDDDANKTAIFVSSNGRFAVGFTGLAKYGRFETQSWFSRGLCDCAKPDFDSKQTIERFSEYATDCFNRDPFLRNIPGAHKRLSIMFTGYLYHHDPPLGALSLITNFENLDTGEISPTARDKFDVFFHKEPRPNPPRMKLFHTVGFQSRRLFSQDLNEAIDMAIDKKPVKAIEWKLVQYIRKISEHAASKNSVGGEIFSVVVPRDRARGFSSNYFPMSTKQESFRPNLIVAINEELHAAFKDVRISCSGESEGQPIVGPKLHRNQQCWCKSGKKYKDCHGSRDYFNPEPTIDFKELIASIKRKR